MTTRSTTCRPRLRHALMLAGLAAVLTVPLSATTMRHGWTRSSHFFIARFEHRLGPFLQDPDNAFAAGGGWVHRTGGVPNDRHYISTVSDGYQFMDWTYEVTFRQPANAPADILFIGFGEAVPDPTMWTEPKNSVNFRIHMFSPKGPVTVVAHDEGYFHWTWGQIEAGDLDLSNPAGGVWTSRIRKSGHRVTFEILGTDVIAVIPNLDVAAPFLKDVPTRMFVGNALDEYAFTDLRVLPERTRGCR